MRGLVSLLRGQEAHGGRPGQGPGARTWGVRPTGALRSRKPSPSSLCPQLECGMSATVRPLLTCGSFWFSITKECMNICWNHRSNRSLKNRASPVAQWSRIQLPRQETQARSLVQEDPTCSGVTSPVGLRSWATAPEPALLSPGDRGYWRPSPLETPLHSKRSLRSPRPERPRRNEDPAQPKINKIKLL